MSHSSLRKEDEHPEFIHAFNAYTPPGDVTGDLVFVSLHLSNMELFFVVSAYIFFQLRQLRESGGYPKAG